MSSHHQNPALYYTGICIVCRTILYRTEGHSLRCQSGWHGGLRARTWGFIRYASCCEQMPSRSTEVMLSVLTPTPNRVTSIQSPQMGDRQAFEYPRSRRCDETSQWRCFVMQVRKNLLCVTCLGVSRQMQMSMTTQSVRRWGTTGRWRRCPCTVRVRRILESRWISLASPACQQIRVVGHSETEREHIRQRLVRDCSGAPC